MSLALPLGNGRLAERSMILVQHPCRTPGYQRGREVCRSRMCLPSLGSWPCLEAKGSRLELSLVALEC